MVVVRAFVWLATANLVWSVASGVAFARRVSAAIEHLPGPKQSHLGVVQLFARRPDLHRALTELADDYGPIFRMRGLFFRVRCYSLHLLKFPASTAADVLLLLQFVVVTDPPLANFCLRLPAVDKFGFAYSFLQQVAPRVLNNVIRCA